MGDSEKSTEEPEKPPEEEAASASVRAEEEDPLTPRVDMYFETEEDAYEFYKQYAEQLGFLVRKSNKSKNSHHAVTRRLFVCHKQGFRQEKKGHESRQPRPDSRTGCEASLVIKLVPCGAFRVTDFIAEHNHPLARQPTVRMLPGPRAPPPEADPREGPRVDMHFETENDAYAFYNKYAEHVGFSVRRSYKKRKRGLIVSRIFVCSREGTNEKYKELVAGGTSRPGPPPTRTGCPACLVIKITPCRTFRVSKFVPDHNHLLANPECVRKLRSHKTKPKPLDGDLPEHNRTKRLKGMHVGDSGAVLEYLQRLQVDSPSVYYAVGTDGDGKANNFFWADTKSVMDFGYFRDVVCFDTTYSLNSYGRPFALFVGVDNQKQMLIFGAALLYDNSVESLKWLFQAFSNAMRGGKPGTILTDQGRNIADAVAEVWPESAHGVSVWHVFHGVRKHLKHIFENPKSSFANSLTHCLFECEEEFEFSSAWEKMIDKYDLSKNDWLAELYNERQTWALPYGRHVFTADILTTLRKENMINVLKKELNEREDLLQFFKHYENVLEEHRSMELQNDVDSSPTLPMPSLRILRQASNAYTPAAFKMFQSEFETFMNCMAYQCGVVGSVSEYKVTVDEKSTEYMVKYDALDGSVTCSCKKFEFVGIQCSHVLKILDYKNIKELPTRYIVRRWTKGAKSGRIGGDPEYGSDIISRSSMENRYHSLCRVGSMIAARAAKSDEAIGFIESQSNAIMKHLDNILEAGFPEIGNHTSTLNSQSHNLIRSQHHNHHAQTSAVPRTTNGILGM